tara:strand:- start:435 stop:539 length:105 start_codon:yes stop_codon:yes gene_type:complete
MTDEEKWEIIRSEKPYPVDEEGRIEVEPEVWLNT